MMSLPPDPQDAAEAARKIIELEEKLTFQQQSVEQLNGVVLQLQADLASLRRELESFRSMVEELLDMGVGDDLPQEKPPHY